MLYAAKLDTGQTIAFVTRNDRSQLAKFRLYDAGGGKVGYAPLVRFHLPAQFTLPNGQTWTPCQDEDGLTPTAEGTVIDRDRGLVYIGQEAVGLWRTTIDNPVANLTLIEKVSTFGTPYAGATSRPSSGSSSMKSTTSAISTEEWLR